MVEAARKTIQLAFSTKRQQDNNTNVKIRKLIM